MGKKKYRVPYAQRVMQTASMQSYSMMMDNDYNELSDPRFWDLDDDMMAMMPPMRMNQKKKPKVPQLPHSQEEEEEVDEELGVAETYADYMPAKLKLGRKHPDPVVETASLSSVAPADVWYKLSIPEETIEQGHLSALQLESITYASQQHEHMLPDGSRAGFLIGDGAGVGKGRTIAGILLDNHLKNRQRAIWVSISNDLKYDAERDLNDIGAGDIKVHFLNKFKYADISSATNGNVTDGVIFSTYSALIGESNTARGKFNSRFQQLMQWCGPDFDGLIIFDECHKAKNLCPVGSTKPTKTGLTVLKLQNELPKARVVYASATGASEPRNMAYMVRLGMWGDGTHFKQFNDFINVFSKRGVSAMEIVAMDMKLRGTYIARQLSFQGVLFKIEEVPLTDAFIRTYDASVRLWVEAMQAFSESADLLDLNDPQTRRTKKTMWCQFWASHQRFFKYLCIAAKVTHAVNIANEAIKSGKCVVIGLQSTGEARTLEQLEREDGAELTGFFSTAKGVFQSLVEKHLPGSEMNRMAGPSGLQLPSSSTKGTKRKPKGKQAVSKTKLPKRSKQQPKPKMQFVFDSDDSDFDCEDEISDEDSESDSYESLYEASSLPRGSTNTCQKKKYLLGEIEKLGDQLPPNTLDQLIDELGGPDKVAEMTGRKGRLVQTLGGNFQYESRVESDVTLETLNLTEKKRFMDGEKDVAIISEAASSGISLQSDRRVPNQRRRVHITLELPWSADRAIQQFGRTHRSNQVNAPEYIFLISDLAGERRFASIVAKRLESLGALTHGDRRATETRDLSQYNIDNKYGRAALAATMKAVMGGESPLVQAPQDYNGDFFRDVSNALIGVGLVKENETTQGALDKDHKNMSRFLNRILGTPVDLQNRLFKYLTDTLAAIISQAKRVGSFDLGILDLGAGGENVNRARTLTFLRKHATGTAPTELHTIHVERGMSWEEVSDKWAELTGPKEGFYLSHQVRNNKHQAILAVEIDSRMEKNDNNKDNQMYYVYRPNTGLHLKQESLTELEKKFTMVKSVEAEEPWKQQYNASLNTCNHKYWRSYCRTMSLGNQCEVGLRRRTYNVLSGSVLSAWSLIENILEDLYGSYKMQVIRLKTDDGLKVVGILIPPSCVESIIDALSQDAENIQQLSF